jgi:hypothetical protein
VQAVALMMTGKCETVGRLVEGLASRRGLGKV